MYKLKENSLEFLSIHIYIYNTLYHIRIKLKALNKITHISRSIAYSFCAIENVV